MEDGASVVPLPCIDDVEVTSVAVMRRAYAFDLHAVLTMQDLETSWRLIGRGIAASLLQGKGVRLPGLLTLTYDITGALAYDLEMDKNHCLQIFGSGHAVRWQPGHRYLKGKKAPVLPTLPLQSAAKLAQRKRLLRRKREKGSTKGQPAAGQAPAAITRRTLEVVVVKMAAAFILTARTSARSIALSLEDVGELLYVAPPGSTEGKDVGVGARGHLAVRFRADFVAACVQARTGSLLENPILRAYVSSDSSNVTLAEMLRGDKPGKLLEALSSSGKPDREKKRAVAVIAAVRARLMKRYGSIGLALLRQSLDCIDEDLEIDAGELRWCLRDFGIEISEDESLAVISCYDENGGGTLSIPELMVGLRGPGLSPTRKKLIERVFATLLSATEGAEPGELDVKTLLPLFNPWCYPPLRDNLTVETAETVTHTFFSLLDASGDGGVTQKEFHRMYRNISSFMESDSEFREFITGSWKPKASSKGLGAAQPLTKAAKQQHQQKQSFFAETAEDERLDAILDAIGDEYP